MIGHAAFHPRSAHLTRSGEGYFSTLECSGSTELWNRRAATFFGTSHDERAAPESSKAGSGHPLGRPALPKPDISYSAGSSALQGVDPLLLKRLHEIGRDLPPVAHLPHHGCRRGDEVASQFRQQQATKDSLTTALRCASLHAPYRNRKTPQCLFNNSEDMNQRQSVERMVRCRPGVRLTDVEQLVFPVVGHATDVAVTAGKQVLTKSTTL